jgi:hypothetical protein
MEIKRESTWNVVYIRLVFKFLFFLSFFPLSLRIIPVLVSKSSLQLLLGLSLTLFACRCVISCNLRLPVLTASTYTQPSYLFLHVVIPSTTLSALLFPASHNFTFVSSCIYSTKCLKSSDFCLWQSCPYFTIVFYKSLTQHVYNFKHVYVEIMLPKYLWIITLKGISIFASVTITYFSK